MAHFQTKEVGVKRAAKAYRMVRVFSVMRVEQADDSYQPPRDIPTRS